MSPDVRPLRFVSAHARGAVELRVLSALLAWMHDWIPNGAPEPALRVRAELDAAAMAAAADLHATANGRVWFRRSDADDCALAAALLGAAALPKLPTDPVFAGALAQARRARNRAVAQALVGAHEDAVESVPDPALRAFGAGALQIECETVGLSLLADGGVLRQVPPREVGLRSATPAVALERTLANAPVRVEVDLGSVEIELASLLELGRGDVIRVPTRLTEGALVHIDGAAIGRASLGTHEGRRAVQLVATGDMERNRR